VVSSPLPRTVQTAQIICDKVDYKEEVELFDDLREFDMGEYEGKIKKINFIDTVTINYKKYGCENVDDVTKRTMKVMITIIEKCCDDTDYLIVSSHGGALMCVLGKINNIDPMTIRVGNGEIFEAKSEDFCQKILS
jgi:broad specificity phosphatase PhoE